jgi:hypothetical protein
LTAAFYKGKAGVQKTKVPIDIGTLFTNLFGSVTPKENILQNQAQA